MPLILPPTATLETSDRQLRLALPDLTGKVVGFIDNTKPNFNHLADDRGDLLIKKFGVRSVVKQRKHSSSRAASEALMSTMVESCDAVVVGSGD